MTEYELHVFGPGDLHFGFSGLSLKKALEETAKELERSSSGAFKLMVTSDRGVLLELHREGEQEWTPIQ